MWKTTIKGLMAHKLRLGLTALAVVLGVAFIAGTFVLTDTMNRTFDNLFSDVTQGVDVFVRSKSQFESQLGGSRQSFDQGLLLTVEETEGVEAAAGSVSGYAQFVDKKGEAVVTGGAPTIGASWYDQPKGSLTIRTGREPRSANEVVIDAATATKHGFKVGDKVRVLSATGSREFEVVGIAGFGDADNLGGATLAVFALPTAQQLFDKEGKLDSIDVAAEDGVTAQDLIERISEMLPEGMEAVSGESVAEEQADSIKRLLGFFNTVLLVFAGIALFVGAFIIFNTFSITVAQRTREFGLLRSLGASGKQVTFSVFLEALLIGIVASAVGIAAGVGTAVGLKYLLSRFGIDLPSSGLVILPRTVLVGMGVGIVVTLVAAIGPARRASKVSPMAALRESAPRSGEGFSHRRTVIGLLILLLGAALLLAGLFGEFNEPVQLVGAGAVLVFLGVAVLAPLFAGPLARLLGGPVARLRHLPGKLARKNAARSPRRTAATAAALMIGLALVGFVSILGASVKASTGKVVDESLKADYTVTNGNRMGPPIISPEVASELYDLPEVESVAPIRLGEFKRSDGRRFFVVATDPDALQVVADIEVVGGDLEALEEDGIFIHELAAKDLGLAVGDKFSMEFPTGKKDLEVVGIFKNKSLIQSDYLISIPTYDANYSEHADSRMLVKLKRGVTRTEATQAMESIEKRFPNVRIEDQAETKETTAAQVNRLLGLVNALLGLAIIIALLGITNTLALSVFERTRELGLLRAVGMSRKQVRSMVRWESVIIAVIGACLGIVIGVFFGWALVTALDSEGITELSIPVGQLLIYVLIAGLAGVLAALPPARRAARLNVLEAISTE
jgi:putative ABC transport system permease protein